MRATAVEHDDRAFLAQLEAKLFELESAHDFEAAGPGPEIEALIARIAEVSIRLDGPVPPAPRPTPPPPPIDWRRIDSRLNGTSPESIKRSDRRRLQRAAERRRRAARKRDVRRCKCGCGKKIPPEADPRRKFIDGHKDAFHNRKRRAT